MAAACFVATSARATAIFRGYHQFTMRCIGFGGYARSAYNAYVMTNAAAKALDTERTTGRILSIDYGRRRIGLAVSDELRVTAQPLARLERTNRSDDVRRLREIARRHQARLVIVGHPLHLDGRPSEMAAETEHFAARIEKALRIPVELVDERLTSWEAAQTLRETGARPDRDAGHRSRRQDKLRTRKPRRTAASSSRRAIDDVAAAVLLREYLERPHSPNAARIAAGKELTPEKEQRAERNSD